MTDAATHWKRLRLKIDPTQDDPDWRGLGVTPNRLTALVGGTTTAGTYSLFIVGKYVSPEGKQVDIDAVIPFVRVAQTDAQIATGLDTAFDAAMIRSDSSVLLTSLGFSCSVSTATLTILFPPGFIGRLTNSAPGSASIAQAIGADMPICASAPHFGRAGNSGTNGIVIMWQCFDEIDGTVQLPPGVSTQPTMTLQAIELAEVETVDARGDRTYRYVVGATAVIEDTEPDTPYELPLKGAKFWTVRMITDADLPAGTASVDVIYRESTT